MKIFSAFTKKHHINVILECLKCKSQISMIFVYFHWIHAFGKGKILAKHLAWVQKLPEPVIESQGLPLALHGWRFNALGHLGQWPWNACYTTYHVKTRNCDLCPFNIKRFKCSWKSVKLEQLLSLLSGFGFVEHVTNTECRRRLSRCDRFQSTYHYQH